MSEIAKWVLFISGIVGMFGFVFYLQCRDRDRYREQFYKSCLSEKKEYECDALYSQALRVFR